MTCRVDLHAHLFNGFDLPVASFRFLHMHRRPSKFLETYRERIEKRFGDDLIESVFGGAALEFLGLNIAGNMNRGSRHRPRAAVADKPVGPVHSAYQLSVHHRSADALNDEAVARYGHRHDGK